MALSAESKADLDRAVRAYMASSAGLVEFQNACIRGDEQRAEEARTVVLGSMEAFMDNFAAAYLR